MTAPYRFEVDQFIDYFREQASAIGGVESPLHRKILYLAALEPLARAAFGKEMGHRDRMERLVVDLASWNHAERISLPQLSLQLRGAGRTRYRLYREAYRRLRDWPIRRPIALDRSPTLEQLLPYAGGEIEREALRQTRYVGLFYTYRNNLIHEYREPGYGTDWSGRRTEPFYSHSVYGPWQLTFPVCFLASLYAQALEGTRVHLLSTRTNPYSRFDFGSLWRRRP